MSSQPTANDDSSKVSFLSRFLWLILFGLVYFVFQNILEALVLMIMEDGVSFKEVVLTKTIWIGINLYYPAFFVIGICYIFLVRHKTLSKLSYSVVHLMAMIPVSLIYLFVSYQYTLLSIGIAVWMYFFGKRLERFFIK